MTGCGILADTASASTQISDDQRQERAALIRQARAQCAQLLQATPTADRLNVLMKECFKDNAHVFIPIEPSPPVQSGPRTPIFNPDPNR